MCTLYFLAVWFLRAICFGNSIYSFIKLYKRLLTHICDTTLCWANQTVLVIDREGEREKERNNPNRFPHLHLFGRQFFIPLPSSHIILLHSQVIIVHLPSFICIPNFSFLFGCKPSIQLLGFCKQRSCCYYLNFYGFWGFMIDFWFYFL